MNNNKVLKSKKPFFTTNKKVVMLLGFIVVVGAVLGALYGTGVIGSNSGSNSGSGFGKCSREEYIDEIILAPPFNASKTDNPTYYNKVKDTINSELDDKTLRKISVGLPKKCRE